MTFNGKGKLLKATHSARAEIGRESSRADSG
jgi:hypothetical protein